MEEKKRRKIEKFLKGLLVVLVIVLIVGTIYLKFFSWSFEWKVLIVMIGGLILGGVVASVKIIPPRHVFVLRNKLTGELDARKPGLTMMIPFIHEVFRVHDCRPIVEEPTSIKALTKEGQTVTLSIQRTYWIDALEATEDEFKGKKEEEGEEKGKRRAVLAAIKISGEKKEEVMEKIKELVDNFTKAHLERLISKVTIDDLEKDTIPRGFTLICPRCGRVLTAEEEGSFPSYCGEEKKKKKEEKEEGVEEKKECDAKWSVRKKELSFPQSLLALISFGTSIWVDHELGEEFGVGCEIRVLNLKPPAELTKARLAKEVMEAEERVKEAEAKVKSLEAEIISSFSQKTKISPNLIYLADGIGRIVERVLSHLEKKGEGEEKEKEKGGE